MITKSDWLKVKDRQTLVVRVEAGDPELVRWGDRGWAVRLTLTSPERREDLERGLAIVGQLLQERADG